MTARNLVIAAALGGFGILGIAAIVAVAFDAIAFVETGK